MITLKTLHEATEQEVFDQVARHLLTQNKASLDMLGNSCQYRGIDGLKCAAGCLISDDEYQPDMERTYWGELVNSNLAPKEHEEIIAMLQDIHDDWPPSRWLFALKDLAAERNLNTSVLDEFK